MSELTANISALNQIITAVADLAGNLSDTPCLLCMSEIMHATAEKTEKHRSHSKFRLMFHEEAVKEAFKIYAHKALKQDGQPGAKLKFAANIHHVLNTLNSDYATLGWVLEMEGKHLSITYQSNNSVKIDLSEIMVVEGEVGFLKPSLETSEALECYHVVSEVLSPGAIKASMYLTDKKGVYPSGFYFVEVNKKPAIISVNASGDSGETIILNYLSKVIGGALRLFDFEDEAVFGFWRESVMHQISNSFPKVKDWSLEIHPDHFTINYSNTAMARMNFK